MYPYRKLPIRQGYIPCPELFDGRCELQLRMLEGDVSVEVDETSVLMTGISREVYPMKRAAFEQSYRILKIRNNTVSKMNTVNRTCDQYISIL